MLKRADSMKRMLGSTKPRVWPPIVSKAMSRDM